MPTTPETNSIAAGTIARALKRPSGRWGAAALLADAGPDPEQPHVEERDDEQLGEQDPRHQVVETEQGGPHRRPRRSCSPPPAPTCTSSDQGGVRTHAGG
jgi:hypothetical protein